MIYVPNVWPKFYPKWHSFLVLREYYTVNKCITKLEITLHRHCAHGPGDGISRNSKMVKKKRQCSSVSSASGDGGVSRRYRNRNWSSGAWLGWAGGGWTGSATAPLHADLASYPTGPWPQRLSRAFLRQVPRPTLASSIWLVASRRPSPGKGNCRFEPLVTSSHLSREPEKLKKLQWRKHLTKGTGPVYSYT